MLNQTEIENLKSVISSAAQTAYEEEQIMVVATDNNSPGWRAHYWEAGDCPQTGLVIGADGVQEARGEFYEEICRQNLGLMPATGIPTTTQP